MSDCQFENVYVELEQHLRRITNLPEWVGVVGIYEKIIPSDRAADIQMLRKTRNDRAHGRKIGGVSPIIPQVWIDCLSAEIDYIKKNEKQVADEVIAVYKKLNNVSFSSALERIFNNRKTDEELFDSFLVYSKLGDICGSNTKSKKIILAYYEMDKKVHFFQSIMKNAEDLRSSYIVVQDIISEQEFLNIVEIIEELVKREKEITQGTSAEVDSCNEKNKSLTQECSVLKRDSTYWECLRFAVIEKTVSITFFQRRLYIGYIRAGEIIEQMEKDGFIEKETEKGYTYKVLLTEEEYSKKYGKLH